MKRRTFLQAATTAAATAVVANATAQPAPTASTGRVRLGIDCYSVRGFQWNAHQLLDYAAGLKLDAIQCNLNDFESLEDGYLRTVREHAERLNVLIEPGIGSVCPISTRYNAARQGTTTEHMLLGIRLAKALGATAIKCYLGNSSDRHEGAPIPEKMEATIIALRMVRAQAVDAGVKFALETHGDLLAREAKTIIEEAGPEYVGCCLDTGNPVALGEDPLMTLEVLGQYTVTTHIRDSAVHEHPQGAAYQWVALGDGSIDYKAFVARYREICPDAPFLMEILTGSPPRVLPYLEHEYWKAFPDMPAADFARFLNLVRNGHPFTGSMMIGFGGDQPPEYAAAIKEQQRYDLERSLAYAKKELDLGVNWRV